MSDKIIFGFAKYKGAVSGVRLQSVTYGESASTAEAMDEDGYIEQTDVYGKKRTIQCEGNCIENGNTAALTVGGTLTVDGVDYKLDSVQFREGNNAHKTASISGSAPMPKPATA